MAACHKGLPTKKKSKPKAAAIQKGLQVKSDCNSKVAVSQMFEAMSGCKPESRYRGKGQRPGTECRYRGQGHKAGPVGK